MRAASTMAVACGWGRASGTHRDEPRGRASGEARERASGEARGRASGKARGRASHMVQCLHAVYAYMPVTSSHYSRLRAKNNPRLGPILTPRLGVRDSRGSGLTTARALGLTVYTPSLGPELWLGPESVPRLGGLLCSGSARQA